MYQGEHNIEWVEHLNTRMRGYKPKGWRSPESLVGEANTSNGIRRKQLKDNLSFQKITDSKMYHGTPIVLYNI